MSDPLFRLAHSEDVDRCYAIERAAYEGDEAATREKIALRIARYPLGFLVMERDGGIVGFINAGCAHTVELADERFKELIGHDPAAPNVVIMSVVIDPPWQGHGDSSRLMRAFVAHMTALGKRSIYLMCRQHHIALYEKSGYRYLRPSPSTHGGLQWYEMVLPLVEDASTASTQS